METGNVIESTVVPSSQLNLAGVMRIPAVRQVISLIGVAAAVALVIVGIGWVLVADNSGEAKLSTSANDQGLGPVDEAPVEEPGASLSAEDPRSERERVLRPDPTAEWGTAIPSVSQLPPEFSMGAAGPIVWLDEGPTPTLKISKTPKCIARTL